MNTDKIRQTAPMQIAAQKRFGGFKPEAEKQSRKPDVQENPTQASLVKAWHDRPLSMGNPGFEIPYFRALVGKTLILRQIRIKAEDVVAFCLSLPDIRKCEEASEPGRFSCKAGLFISALVYLSKDNAFSLPLHNLDRPEYLGYRNNKDIIIQGDAGMFLGAMMSSGNIAVHGDCDDFLGEDMSGGIILVSGNSGSYTGSGMQGGEIRVAGRIRDYDDKIEGGRIYENGELLIQGGEADENDW